LATTRMTSADGDGACRRLTKTDVFTSRQRMAFPWKAVGRHACFQMKLEERILPRRLAMLFQLA
jgi:hypothetical protein